VSRPACAQAELIRPSFMGVILGGRALEGSREQAHPLLQVEQLELLDLEQRMNTPP